LLLRFRGAPENNPFGSNVVCMSFAAIRLSSGIIAGSLAVWVVKRLSQFV
jgi:hypothetical protein